MLILLTAVDAGLGAFYFSIGRTSRQVPAFRRAFGIPSTHDPIGAIAIGHPATSDSLQPSPRVLRGKRRDLTSRIHVGQWHV